MAIAPGLFCLVSSLSISLPPSLTLNLEENPIPLVTFMRNHSFGQ